LGEGKRPNIVRRSSLCKRGWSIAQSREKKDKKGEIYRRRAIINLFDDDKKEGGRDVGMKKGSSRKKKNFKIMVALRGLWGEVKVGTPR